jgi:hypothetical protein
LDAAGSTMTASHLFLESRCGRTCAALSRHLLADVHKPVTSVARTKWQSRGMATRRCEESWQRFEDGKTALGGGEVGKA